MKEASRLWNRTFTILWQGQLISSVGKQAFALSAALWLKHLTESGTLMGLVMTVATLPMVIIGPLSGVLVDRWRRQRLISWTDIIGGLLVLGAALLFLLTPSRTSLLIGVVFAVALATGLLDTISQPAIGASIPDIVPKGRLEAANSLNMAGMQIAVFIAQASAGVLFVAIGMPLLVLANAVTYLWAGGTELVMRIPHRPRPVDARVHPLARFAKDLMEGFRFVVAHRGMRTSLLLYMVLNFLMAPVIVLMPFYVENYLGLGPQWFGYLMALFGVGALVGYLLAGVTPMRGRVREAAVAGSMVVQAAFIIVLVAFPARWFQMAGFVLVGLLNGILNVNFMTLLQTATPPDLLGRVQSLATTGSTAVMPLGMALAGIAFDLLGKSVLLMYVLSGGATLVFSLLGLLSRSYREFLRFVPPAAGKVAAASHSAAEA